MYKKRKQNQSATKTLMDTAKRLDDLKLKTKEEWEEAGFKSLSSLVKEAIKETKQKLDAQAKVDIAKFKGLI